MNPAKHALIAVVSLMILCAANLGTAQSLQEMEVEDLGLAPVVVRNPEESILIVTSVIPKLSFASNMGIIRVNDDTPGKWIVYVHPGTNIITFMSEGYKSVSQRLVVPKKKARKVEVRILKTFGTVIVESEPPGAAIFLDGEDTRKQTPHEFEGQETGTHSLVLKMTHYLTDTTEVEVKAGEITRVTKSLQTVGYLTVHTVPSEAMVVIESGAEDAVTMNTPVELFALKTGAYSVSVVKPGYLSPQLSIVIEKGKIVRRTLDLKRVADLGIDHLVPAPPKFVSSRLFYKKRWFWGVAITGIGSGAYYWWSQQQDGKPAPTTGTIKVDVPWPK